ncbi:MAG: DNA-binding protein [Ideonella sp.]|nr:DNA-binding protein [Ideonella sp.]MCC7455964.1 DNA-binding protein [Nitrospira sp.]
MPKHAKPSQQTPLKTREQVRAEFRAAGVTVAEWARLNDFSRDVVMTVLRGRVRGNYGEGHRVAVALGLKSGQVVDPKKFKAAA